MPVETVRNVLKISADPISLDTPIEKKMIVTWETLLEMTIL